MADKFCSYYNYNVALKKYKVVPVMVKENMSISKLLSIISTPLTFLENNMKELAFFKN